MSGVNGMGKGQDACDDDEDVDDDVLFCFVYLVIGNCVCLCVQ